MIHLHTHSAYSFRDGIAQPKDLAERAAELGQSALGLTDHGNMCGLVAHAKACRDVGIKPIFGVEFYEGLTSPLEPEPHKADQRNYHLTIIAQNLQGWRNLVYLHDLSWSEGFHRHPRIDRAWLEGHTDGLICLSGCITGRVQTHINNGEMDKAEEAALFYDRLFPGRFFLEGMNIGIKKFDYPMILRNLRALGRNHGIPVVATNDVHYTLREHGVKGGTQDVFVACFRGGKHEYIGSPEMFLKTDREMLAMLLKEEELDTSHIIADLCDFDLLAEIKGQIPRVQPKDGRTVDQQIADVVVDRLTLLQEQEGWDEQTMAIYEDRANMELELLMKKGYTGYFFILAEIIGWTKGQGIPVGPGRGSSGGSLVAYLLGITEIDPVKYDLMFSRFLTPGRNTMPDIDVDVSQSRRGEILQHIRDQYGTAYQIAAFQTFGVRAAIELIGAVTGLDRGTAATMKEVLPELVGDGVKVDKEIAWLLDNQPSFVESFRVVPEPIREHFCRLDGIQQHPSTHAAGVALLGNTQAGLVPIIKINDNLCTAWDMYDMEDLGFLKIDMLGLRTMDVISQAAEDAKISLAGIPLDDRETFDLLSEGDTLGVFQLERRGFAAMVRSLKPSNIQHVIDTVALYRPGPLESGMVEHYIRCRHGKEKPNPPIGLGDVTKDTYGILLYQEQVMAAAQILAGYDDTEADDFRKAIGKKDTAVMQKQREKFVSGMVARRYKKEVAEALFSDIEKFARYGFNKSHATAYGLIAYWCAYLKAHHPAEFYARLLNSYEKDKERMAPAIDDLKRHGVVLLPPDINESEQEFQSIDGKAVRFGLLGIKGLGEANRKQLWEDRRIVGPFNSFEELCQRLPSMPIDKKLALVGAGAFDRIHPNRAELLLKGKLINENLKRKKKKELDPDAKEPDGTAMAKLEEELLGFFVRYDPYQALRGLQQEEGVLAGEVVKAKRHTDKAGGLMAFIDLRTADLGVVSGVLFSRVVSRYGIPREGVVVRCWGDMDSRNGRASFVVTKFEPVANSIYDYMT